MRFDLILTSTLGGEDAEGQQFTLPDVQPAAGIEIAEAIGGEIVLKRLLVIWGGGAHFIDVRAETGLLGGNAGRQPLLLGDCALTGQREGDALRPQNFVDRSRSGLCLAKPDIRCAVIDGLLDCLW